jgi:hypothetical protein
LWVLHIGIDHDLNFAINMKLALTSLLILSLFFSSSSPAEAQTENTHQEVKKGSDWQQLGKGLELGIFPIPQTAQAATAHVRVLRIDPNYYRFRLLNVSAIENGLPMTPRQWCRQNKLVAAINPSMFQTDYKTSVSLMRTRTHINNPRLSKDMTIFAFDKLSKNVPPVKIIDRQCEDYELWKKKYGTLIQSIRMISCKGHNVWNQQPHRWSTAAIGIDRQAKVLFIHVRSPYSTYDLINVLKKLALDISRAMYTEGGPQAQLYINSGNKEYEFVGSHDTGADATREGSISWPLPNVVGISKRTLPSHE